LPSVDFDVCTDFRVTGVIYDGGRAGIPAPMTGFWGLMFSELNLLFGRYHLLGSESKRI
jgi:hypothetical protein